MFLVKHEEYGRMTLRIGISAATAATCCFYATLMLGLNSMSVADHGPANEPPASDRNGFLAKARLSAELQTYVDALSERLDWVGIKVALVVGDEGVIQLHAGLADRESGIAMADRHLLHAGSIGKTFAAVVALQLVEEGLLDLDSKLSVWFGGKPWFDRLPNSRDITIRMLMNHSTGIPQHYHQNNYNWNMIWQRWRNGVQTLSYEESIALVLDREPLGEPGAEWHYSDDNYILLGMVVEQVTGEIYYDELWRRVIQPLELKQTLPATSRRIPDLAPGYVLSTWFYRLAGLVGKNMEDGLLHFQPANEFTGGGLVSVPYDIARFYRCIFKCNLLRAETLALIEHPDSMVKVNDNTGYGLGMFVSKIERHGSLYSHSGHWPGYVANVYYYADYDFSIAIQFNSDDNIEVHRPIFDMVEIVVASLQDNDP